MSINNTINTYIERSEILIDIMRMFLESSNNSYRTSYDSFHGEYNIWICAPGLHSPIIIFDYDNTIKRFGKEYSIRWFNKDITSPEYLKTFNSKQEALKELIKWAKVFPNPPE